VIAALIRWSVANRFLVLLASASIAAAGVWSVRTTPLDAIPDLSDTQVIIRTTFPGQAPQIVEDQVTYPLTTTMLSVPGAKAVRGYCSSAIRSCTSCSRTAPIPIGPAPACSST
jgi:Cu(I)/Ag(I) efflux system membrane protein CusA/SilA